MILSCSSFRMSLSGRARSPERVAVSCTRSLKLSSNFTDLASGMITVYAVADDLGFGRAFRWRASSDSTWTVGVSVSSLQDDTLLEGQPCL